MCLPTALALPLHSYGDFGSPVIGSSARCYKSEVTIKSPHEQSPLIPCRLRSLRRDVHVGRRHTTMSALPPKADIARQMIFNAA
jgi:hypothetical protein